MTKYEGRAIRMSNRQYTLAQKLLHATLSEKGIVAYDMRTVVPMVKAGLIEGSLKTGFYGSEELKRRLHAFGHSEIERLNTMYIPEFLLTFHTPAAKVKPMKKAEKASHQSSAITA